MTMVSLRFQFFESKNVTFGNFPETYFSVVFEEILFSDFRGGFWIFCWSLLPGGGACGLIALSLSARPLHFFFFLFTCYPPPSLTLNTKIELEIHFIEITYMKILLGHVTRRSNQKRRKGQNGSLGRMILMTLTVMSPVQALLPNQIQNSGQYSQEFLAAFEKRLLQVCP